jgi:hypothetical protein
MGERSSLAALYRKRAVECVRLSKLSADLGLRKHYRHLAENYLTLARSAVAGAEHHAEGAREPMPSKNRL